MAFSNLSKFKHITYWQTTNQLSSIWVYEIIITQILKNLRTMAFLYLTEFKHKKYWQAINLSIGLINFIPIPYSIIYIYSWSWVKANKLENKKGKKHITNSKFRQRKTQIYRRLGTLGLKNKKTKYDKKHLI